MCQIHDRDWLHLDIKLDNTLANVAICAHISQSFVNLYVHVYPVPVVDPAHARCKLHDAGMAA
jgi:hypothetical protein